jgi:hypothetical protein
MLGYAKVRNHAGMMLVGDYETLRALHDVIQKVVKESALFRKEEHGAHLLGLAYEVRKAFELQREILESPPHYEEIGRRYGVKLLWPVLLVQAQSARSCDFGQVEERTLNA